MRQHFPHSRRNLTIHTPRKYRLHILYVVKPNLLQINLKEPPLINSIKPPTHNHSPDYPVLIYGAPWVLQ